MFVAQALQRVLMPGPQRLEDEEGVAARLQIETFDQVGVRFRLTQALFDQPPGVRQIESDDLDPLGVGLGIDVEQAAATAPAGPGPRCPGSSG